MSSSFAPDDLVFAKPNIAFEPLVNQYYAWLHLISPATAAMNFTKLIAPLLRSFVASPELHRSSSLDPKLRGGMFVNLPESAVASVSQLATRVGDPDGRFAALSAGIDELTVTLEAHADGHDLTAFYAQVPAALRGFVELVYDLNDHPRIRLSEKLLYAANFDETQHVVDLSLCTSDERPFAMTTPRLPQSGHVQSAIPLRDPRVDMLCSAITTPRPFGELSDAFAVSEEDSATFAGLFSATSGMSADRDFAGPGVRVRYFGHACVVMQAGGVTIVTDPFIADNPGEDRFTHADLPDVIDYVVITHGHQDHLELGTLLKLRHKVRTVVVPKTANGALQDPSLKLCLEALGFPHVVDVEPGDKLEFDGGHLVVCPFIGEHCDLDIGAKVTYAVQMRGRTLYFGADNRGVDPTLFTHIRNMVGDVDAVFLGMECDGAPLHWLYGPLFSRRVDRKMSRTRKLNGSDAAEAIGIVRELRAESAYIYAMGREPWLGFVMATSYTDDSYQLKQMAEFIERCGQDGVKAEELLWQAEFCLSAKGADAS